MCKALIGPFESLSTANGCLLFVLFCLDWVGFQPVPPLQMGGPIVMWVLGPRGRYTVALLWCLGGLLVLSRVRLHETCKTIKGP